MNAARERYGRIAVSIGVVTDLASALQAQEATLEPQ